MGIGDVLGRHDGAEEGDELVVERGGIGDGGFVFCGLGI